MSWDVEQDQAMAPLRRLLHLPYRISWTHADSQQLSAKINNNIERQMVNAASSGKLTIMKNKGGEDP